MAGGQLNTFLDRLLQYVPEDQKAAARSTYSAAADRAALLERNAEAVQSTAAKQNEWWAGNKDAVQERDRLRAELASRGTTNVDTNAINAAIAEANARTLETGLGLVTAISTIVSRHQAEFGEPLDATKLAKEAIAAQMPIDQFYDSTVATRRQERNDAARAAELAKAREEGIQAGRQEMLARTGQGLPFPSATGANAPVGTLAGLRKPAEGAANPFSLEAAVATAVSVANAQNQ